MFQPLLLQCLYILLPVFQAPVTLPHTWPAPPLGHLPVGDSAIKRHPPWVVLGLQALSLGSRLPLAATHQTPPTIFTITWSSPQAQIFLREVPRPQYLLSRDCIFLHVYLFMFIIPL